MLSVDKVLDEIMQLESEERELLVEILNKRQIEDRRKKIARNYNKALREMRAGKLKAESAKEIIKKMDRK